MCTFYQAPAAFTDSKANCGREGRREQAFFVQRNKEDWGDKEGTDADRRILDDLIKKELKKAGNIGIVIPVEFQSFDVLYNAANLQV